MVISTHAKERYAERIMGHDEKADRAVFIASHEEKICGDIEKMISYGSLIYSGPSTKTPGRTVEIYLNGLWVVIYDPGNDTVVTLYEVDLGVGEDMNRQYVAEVVKRIDEARAEYEETCASTKEMADAMQSIIDDSDAQINEFRKKIKALEEVKRSYSESKSALINALSLKADDLVENVKLLTGRKIF